jgi:hypothetical protein
LHLRDVDLALRLGCEPARNVKHIAQLREDNTVIMVHHASGEWPLYWRWQLGLDDRSDARKNAPRGR